MRRRQRRAYDARARGFREGLFAFDPHTPDGWSDDEKFAYCVGHLDGTDVRRQIAHEVRMEIELAAEQGDGPCLL